MSTRRNVITKLIQVFISLFSCSLIYVLILGDTFFETPFFYGFIIVGALFAVPLAILGLLELIAPSQSHDAAKHNPLQNQIPNPSSAQFSPKPKPSSETNTADYEPINSYEPWYEEPEKPPSLFGTMANELKDDFLNLLTPWENRYTNDEDEEDS